jgi:hypothetical protein
MLSVNLAFLNNVPHDGCCLQCPLVGWLLFQAKLTVSRQGPMTPRVDERPELCADGGAALACKATRAQLWGVIFDHPSTDPLLVGRGWGCSVGNTPVAQARLAQNASSCGVARPSHHPKRSCKVAIVVTSNIFTPRACTKGLSAPSLYHARVRPTRCRSPPRKVYSFVDYSNIYSLLLHLRCYRASLPASISPVLPVLNRLCAAIQHTGPSAPCQSRKHDAHQAPNALLPRGH